MSIFEKIYNRINWQNKPSTETPINAENLNVMDSAIDDLDDRCVSLSESVNTNTTDISTLQTDIRANSETISTHTSDIALLKHEVSITALRGVYSTVTFTNYESNNINLTELFGSPVAFLVSSYAHGSASQVIPYVVDATVNNYTVKVRDMSNASGTYTVGFIAVLYKG